MLLNTLFSLAACTGSDASDSAAVCISYHAVVTDIDETLTTSDEEWLQQMTDSTHDPEMRPDANTLLNAYAEQGYGVFYVTARGDGFTLSDGRTAFEGTRDWLVAHDFPVDESRITLSEGFGVAGDDAAAYKAEVLADEQALGWSFDWAYGNADSDIAAFKEGGIPSSNIFLVGELAGTLEVEPILDEDAYTNHLATQLDAIEPTECAGL